MKKVILATLAALISFSAQAHAEDAAPLAADVAIKCVIFPYDASRTRIPDHPLGELTVKKEALAGLETSAISLGSIEGLPQVNFELNKDIDKYNPDGNISMSFVETNAERSSSMILAGGSLNKLGGSMLLYRSAHSQNIYIAQCQKQ